MINYGEKDIQGVCGTIDAAGKIHLGSEDSKKYSILFQEEWKKNRQEENILSSQSRGQQQCDGSSGVILSTESDSGISYLGFCDESNVENSKFLKIEKTGIEKRTTSRFLVCDKDCWENITKQGEGYQLQNAKEGNGKEVKFLRYS